MSSDSGKPSAAQLLATVQASPAAVARHDRAAWVNLFARDAEVHDPVGSRPHRGRAAIERFYDTFIAPNTIVFHVDHDVVCGMTVMRDLCIETTLSTGVTLQVPMHLRYDVVEEAGALRIQRLFAHWELMPMMQQLLGRGLKGAWTSFMLGPQMLRHQGLGGIAGFSQGFIGVGAAGKRRVERLLAALGRGDVTAAEAELAPGAALQWPHGTTLALREFVTRASGLRGSKLLAAGRGVTATVTQADGTRGVALFRFDAGEARIGAVELFFAQS